MTAIAFDTLSASKRLREAGMDERAAEAIVDIMRHTTELPDVADLVTKTELALTRADLKAEIATVRTDISALEARLSEKIRLQRLALIGAMATLLAVSTALIKLVP
jgi:hypothetical protein